MKKLILLILIIINIAVKAQTIPNAEMIFTKVETWQSKHKNLFGELLREENSKMTVSVYNGNNNEQHTYIVFKGDFVDGQTTFTIRSF